jgi:chromate transporter
MESDAVSTYHWMTHAQFLNAVALGQVTPGPLVQTVAAVGYSADGIAGGLLAAVVAFVPSFSFVLIGAARFERLLVNERVIAFLAGAAPAAAAGAIIGSAVPLAAANRETWQFEPWVHSHLHAWRTPPSPSEGLSTTTRLVFVRS